MVTAPSPVPDLVRVDSRGLWCAAGGFHVDPWKPVDLAVVTHAHSDHARPGSARYLAAAPSVPVLRRRLQDGAVIDGVPFGETVTLGDARVSFHPAGHVLGSAQVRIESGGTVWVVSGDYKRDADRTCQPFEPVRCDGFITEATFALPIYRWPSTEAVARQVIDWWDQAATAGKASVLFCYAFGKAQRLLAELHSLRPDAHVYLHGALVALTEIYRDAGIALPLTSPVAETAKGHSFAGQLILAPPSAGGSTWMRRFGKRPATAFASGWMRVRGSRRRRAVDRGFVFSDHADWPGLLQTIRETGARRVLTTHGYSDTLARYLREACGLDAEPLETRYRGETDEADTDGVTAREEA